MSSADSSEARPLSMARLDPSSRDIRILSLMPGQPADPIICSLSKASLYESPQYDALSYVWGDPSICNKISLEQQERNVTVNLFAALRRLRHATERKQLWVDALCINQDDDDEKTHQVGLMGFIYSRAREVLLWLGDYVQDSSMSAGELELGSEKSIEGHPSQPGTVASHGDVVLGFAFLQILANHGPGTTNCVLNTLRDDAQDGQPNLPRGLSAYERGLRTVMEFSWWTRLWTVQEAVLSRKTTVVCGDIQLPWNTLDHAATNLRVNSQYCRYQCCSGLDSTLVYRFYNKVKSISSLAEWPCVEVFAKFRDRVSSDRRDRVYALLGVLQNSGVKPDYSLDHRAAYADAVVSIIRNTKALDMLWRPREFDRDPMLPSWVPDWTARVDTGRLGMELNQFRNLMLESCMDHPCIVLDYTPERGALTLVGVQVDTVISTSDAIEDAHLSACATDPIIRSWQNSIIESQPYPGGGTYEEAFWRLMAGDHIILGSGTDRIVGSLEDVLIVMRGEAMTIATMGTYRQMETEEWRLIKDDYEGSRSLLRERSVPHILVNQRFFLTESGLIGLGPFDTRIGDTVQILLGGKCPFLLRKVAETGTFNLVGASFVQGIMYGEAVPDGTMAQAVTLV